jgi:ectoine hydroxylase-related dioxygenase (phytanoyl-CoA dioxygenase family)
MPIAEQKIDSELIDKLKEAFHDEIYNYESNLLRQGDRLEKHIYNNGVIENGILQSHILKDIFPKFTDLLQKITTHNVIKKTLEQNNAHKFKLIQTMVFHGNPLTSLHTDDIYLDSYPAGNLIGMLTAFEDFNEYTGGIGLYELTKEEIDSIYCEIRLPDNFSGAEEIYKIRGLFLESLKKYCKTKKYKSY